MIKWYDVRNSKNRWRTYNMFLGGRGIGKTYSLVDYVFGTKKQFLYVRSTERQIDLSLSPDRGNPFKRWSSDHKRNIYIKAGKEINEIVEIKSDAEGNETTCLCGYAVALSTFENLRGVDFSDIDIIMYDEFIQTAPLRFDVFRAFLNMYESVNRNRELTGDEPVKVFFLANTQELNNGILAGFDLITDIEKMFLHGQKRYSRGDFYIELCQSSISQMKETSVLYRNLPKNHEYRREAIDNQFARNDFSGIGKIRNFREYKPLCNIDGFTIYSHKSRMSYYVNTSYSNKVPSFNSKNQKALFYRAYGGRLSDAYARGLLYCDTFVTRQHILTVLNII